MFTVSVRNWFPRRMPMRRPSLAKLAAMPESRLPRFVRESHEAMEYLRLLGPLDGEGHIEGDGRIDNTKRVQEALL